MRQALSTPVRWTTNWRVCHFGLHREDFPANPRRRVEVSCRMPDARLDAWVADPAIRIHHRRSARADPDALCLAASRVRLRDTRSLGRIVRWRIPGLEPDLSYHDLFRGY